MTDLVERLREAAPQAGHYGAWSGGVLLEQAADELTRLRAEVEALHVAYSQGVADGRVAERDRCAKLCENLRWPAWVESTTDAREAMAEAIRALE